MTKTYDAVVVGSGPNGLAAAIVLARAGKKVLVLEAASKPGGGMRTAELTVPGFMHDVCSTVHPLGAASPFFASLQLERYGLRWIHGQSELVHVLADGTPVILDRSLDATAAQLGRDGPAYRKLLKPLVDDFDEVVKLFLGPLRIPTRRLALFTRFGLQALRSMEGLAAARFEEPFAPALLAGIAAHAMVPLDSPISASFGLILAAAAHAAGWPIAQGGSQAICNALVACLQEHGGEMQLGTHVASLADLPSAKTYLFDVTPKQLLDIAGEVFTPPYRAALSHYRYGLGVFKMDWALRGPVPWSDARCARAPTVHLAGDFEQVASAELAAHQGRIAQEPFLLFVQPTTHDTSRAPAGQHIAWAYCHVPNGSRDDVSDRIEAYVERFAPGFRELIIGRKKHDTATIEAYNPNYIGGDINGGIADWRQLFFRPVAKLNPYRTSAPNIFICSSSTPPGGGVHGLCGYYAAQSVLRAS